MNATPPRTHNSALQLLAASHYQSECVLAGWFLYPAIQCVTWYTGFFSLKARPADLKIHHQGWDPSAISIVSLPAPSPGALLVTVLLLKFQPPLVLRLFPVERSDNTFTRRRKKASTYRFFTLSSCSALVSPGTVSRPISTIALCSFAKQLSTLSPCLRLSSACITKASDFAAQYLDLRMPGRRMGGRSGSSEEVDRRRVALELTLHKSSVYGSYKYSRDYETYLFTFWPPGPEDLLKDMSHILRGMVFASNLASHLLAASVSSSSTFASSVSLPRDANARIQATGLGDCCRPSERIANRDVALNMAIVGDESYLKGEKGWYQIIIQSKRTFT